LLQIIEYKSKHGVALSDEILWNHLQAVLLLLDQLNDFDILRFALWFLAEIDLESQKLIGLILESKFKQHILQALDEAPDNVVDEAVLAIRNLVQSAGDEHTSTLLKMGIMQPLFSIVRCNLGFDVGKAANETLAKLIESSFKAVAENRRKRNKK
jgi:hypothetical protein